jgi:PAS domain S-box-containing protein
VTVISLLLFFSCINYIYLGITTYRLDSKSSVNRMMLVACLTLAVWAFAYSCMHATYNRHAAYEWYTASTFGWNLFFPIVLHLYLLLSHREKHLNAAVLLMIYLPAVTGVFVSNFYVLHQGMLQKIPYGWVLVYDFTSPAVLLFIIMYFIYFVASCVSLLAWGLNSRFKREKKQMCIIIFTTVFSVALGVCNDYLLPALGIAIFPIMAPFAGMIWLFGLLISIKKYRLMTIDTSFAASEIIKSMKDLMVLVDYQGIIREISPHTCITLEYQAKELYGKSIDVLVAEKKILDDELSLFADPSRESRVIDMLFITRAGNTIPVRLSGSALRDSERDLLGIVFVGYDLRETRKLVEMQRMMDLDMEMAARVQTRILHTEPPRSRDWDLHLVFRPVFPVSGDFYDFYEIDGILRGLSMFDVSGHGVSAGLITMIARSIVFRVFRSSANITLNVVLDKINEELIEQIGDIDNFITGTLLRFRGSRVEYVNAGHTELLCKRASDGSVSVINLEENDFRGGFLGVHEMVSKFMLVTFGVSPGDQILLYSDELVETSDSVNEHYGLERLKETFRRAPVSRSEDTADYIVRDVKQFTGGQPFRDDLTIIMMTKK